MNNEWGRTFTPLGARLGFCHQIVPYAASMTDARIAQLETEVEALKKRVRLMSLVQSFTIIALSLLGIAFSMSRMR
jgi:hypothetical protein